MLFQFLFKKRGVVSDEAWHREREGNKSKKKANHTISGELIGNYIYF